MYKKVLLPLIFLLVTTLAFGQQTPAVNLTLIVADNAGGSRTLHIGLDPAATTGIDPQFGESDLPPFPPLGAYEARWNLQPFGVGNLSTYRDYRNAPVLPYTGTVIHRLIWQYSDFATQLSVTYNLPNEVRMLITSNNSVPVWQSDTLTGSGTFTLNDPDNEYTAARVYVYYNNIIPVELSSFSASVVGSSVILNWTTATELNNRDFEVQRKTDNTDWQTLTSIAGAGTTTEPRSYSYTDNNLQSNTKYYYRLRQNDFDGKFSFSQIIEVDISAPKDFNLEQNYPNPFNPSTNISFTLPYASVVKLSIYNQLGEKVDQLVNQSLEAGSYIYNWNAKNNSSGIYVVELQADGYKASKKMMLMK